MSSERRGRALASTGVAALAAAAIAWSGCGDNAEQKVNDAVDQANQAVQDAQDQVDQASQGAQDQAEQALQDAQDQLDQATGGN
jgi:ElaB/YqjD/DUF883 family membrane-anchored ribosome-binding protein